MEIIKEPFSVNAFGRGVALHPDAAVAGLFPEMTFVGGIVQVPLTGSIRSQRAGNLMDEDAAVDAHPCIAAIVSGPEHTFPTDNEEFPGGSLQGRNILRWNTGRNHERGKELSVAKHIHPLQKLVDGRPLPP